MDADALLFAGEPGTKLTWMDAVTPRIGKPVEVQALWINALRIAADFSPHWKDLYKTAQHNFIERFWSIKQRCLFDVVDADRRPFAVDTQIRPNQIFAVGGLPYPLLTGEKARAVVNKVEQYLYTPLGLRSLAPGEFGYCERYVGGPSAREAAYHQGSVWLWLMGPFVEAWMRVNGGAPSAKQEATERFLKPLLKHVGEAGLQHVTEVADAEAPHAPGGCPFQAWSLGELLRLITVILA
jgi:predicted glycogen debranching enzyme